MCIKKLMKLTQSFLEFGTGKFASCYWMNRLGDYQIRHFTQALDPPIESGDFRGELCFAAYASCCANAVIA
jgi:hypothetical protein